MLATALLAPTLVVAVTAKSAEEVWKALDKLPAAEREKRLIESAKAEKKMLWYTTGVDNANNYLRAFKKAYPFINAKVWRAKSRTITDRFLTEARAGVFLADIIKNSTNLLPPLFEQHLITVYPYNMETMRAQKAPVDWIAPDMIPGLLYPLTMMRAAPHPYSAALFYDFLLSSAGQKLIAAEGRIVADPKIEPIFPKMRELKQLLGSARVHINTAEEAPQFYNDSPRILDEAVLGRKR